MSDDKQPKPKRMAPIPLAVPEPAALVQDAAQEAAQAVVEALPAPEARPALPAPVPDSPRDAGRYFATYSATLASLGESQMAVASDMTAMALEMSGFARSHLTVAGDSVMALMNARSLVDAVEAQLGFARRSIEAMAGGATRLGEIGLRLANDAAAPMLRPIAVR